MLGREQGGGIPEVEQVWKERQGNEGTYQGGLQRGPVKVICLKLSPNVSCSQLCPLVVIEGTGMICLGGKALLLSIDLRTSY